MAAEDTRLSTGTTTRIALVEDHPVFRQGLRQLLEGEPDLQVDGEFEDIAGAWEGIARDRPDMVIVDISLKGRSGLELVTRLRDEFPDLPALVLSMHQENLYASRALAAGARGYIMKHEAPKAIIDATRRVLAGEIYVSPRIANQMMWKFVGGEPEAALPEQKLTDRELEVFEMIGHGLTTKEISEKLSLGFKTIGTYRERIKTKLHLRNATELTRCAVKWLDQQSST